MMCRWYKLLFCLFVNMTCLYFSILYLVKVTDAHSAIYFHISAYSAITDLIYLLLMRFSSLRTSCFVNLCAEFICVAVACMSGKAVVFSSHLSLSFSVAHLVRKHGFCASPEQRNRYSLLAGRLHDVIVMYSAIILLWTYQIANYALFIISCDFWE